MWKNIVQPGQTTDENMAHAHYVINIKGYKRTLTKCNNYCFSTATTFTLKRLILLCMNIASLLKLLAML
jgi:hypothetical protein